jgi:two-component system, chemotaxis family, chemotaxis protein CheV
MSATQSAASPSSSTGAAAAAAATTASSPRGTAALTGAASRDAGILLEAGTNEVEILAFTVGNLRCGVNVAKVREARVLETVTALPHFPDCVEGVVRVRDTVVPAVDLQRYLWGIACEADSASQRHLVLEFNDRQIAFRVQGIDRVYRLSWSAIKPPPHGIGDSVPLTGIVLIDGQLLSLLDFEWIGAQLGLSGHTRLEGDATVAPAPARPCRLVFADDSALIRRMMSDALDQAGFKDHAAFEDGQDAWNHLHQLANNRTKETIGELVACVITDIEMPQMDGFNLTRQIRSHPVLCDLPVILFSSLVSKDNEKKGAQVGATAQISKPKWSELTAALTGVLNEVLGTPA